MASENLATMPSDNSVSMVSEEDWAEMLKEVDEFNRQNPDGSHPDIINSPNNINGQSFDINSINGQSFDINNSNDQSFDTIDGNENSTSLQDDMTAPVQYPDLEFQQLQESLCLQTMELSLEPQQPFNGLGFNQPLGSNEQFLGTNEQLMTFNEQSMALIDQPMTFNEQPMIFNKQPMAFNEQPMTFNEQPMIFNKQPMAFNEQSMALNQQLQWSFNQQPMGSVPQPPIDQQPLLNPELGAVYNNVGRFVTQPHLEAISETVFYPVSHTASHTAYDPSLGLSPSYNSDTNSDASPGNSSDASSGNSSDTSYSTNSATTSCTTSSTASSTTSNTTSGTSSGTSSRNISPVIRNRISGIVKRKSPKLNEIHRCEECKAWFLKKSQLKTHLTSSRAHPLLHLQCRCGKSFDKYGLQQHLSKKLKKCESKTDYFQCHCGKVVSNLATDAEKVILGHAYDCGSQRNRTAE